MMAVSNSEWQDANQRYLVARLASVRWALAGHAARASNTVENEQSADDSETDVDALVQEAARALPAPSALDSLCGAFALSPFERDVVLLCAGTELDSTFAPLCAAAQGHARAFPTFSLALAALPGAHWSALAPTSALRHWRLIETGAGDTLTTSQLRLDERVLHYLTGVSYVDARLNGLIELVAAPPLLPPSQADVAERIAHLWSRSRNDAEGWPLVVLAGERDGTRAVAAQACAALDRQLRVLHAGDIPAAAAEREALARLWERESVLSGNALLLDDDGESGNSRAALSFMDSVSGPLLVTSRDPLRRVWTRHVVRMEVPKPSAAEQHSLWQDALGPLSARLNGELDSVTSQFSFGLDGIRAASAQALDGSQDADEAIGARLWEACRVSARSRLDDLAQRIDAVAGWNDLVLPDSQLQILKEIAAQVHQRAKVYGTWGFAAKGSRGLGIGVLFAGASGTGKTMAAEVLANELRLDLYRIDLSQVVSKYIGETEKNLRRVFDAAEDGGAVLLFDEADALFGKRSDVKDSHDRYANIEISYLLQRMEAYRGLAILTTNLKSVLDSAFLRRLRFVVQFPFPDAGQRAEIWRRIFPERTPLDHIDADKLARLNVAGGNIRNIALQAAFLAAAANEPVRMAHLLRAARGEYAKLEKPLTEAESRDWI